MEIKKLYLFFFSVSFFSCNRQVETSLPNSIRDTVLKEYVRASENDPYFETDMSFEVLKAYYRNDTLKLQNFHESYLRYTAKKEKEHFDSCVNQPDLQNSGATEAYRFKYSKAFCPELINITVYNKKDSIILHFVNFYSRVDMPLCNIIKEYDKRLTLNDWKKIESAIRHSDFWALRHSNESYGFDGDDLTVVGFKKIDSLNGRDKFHTVYRWSAGSTDIVTPFLIALRLSGYEGCLAPE